MKSFKIVLVALLTLITNYASAQFCTSDTRFSEIEFFANTQIDSLKNVTYGNALTWDGVSEDLKIDYYFPKTTIDPMPSRPFILMIHGGGFNIGAKEDLILECRELAKRGYVVATMNYRLGGPVFVESVYRAQQDANAALRYSIEIATSLEIDTSWMFIGGMSAGSITSFFTHYMSQDDWNSVNPTIETMLGALDTSGNNLPHTFEIDGIFNQWGASVDSATTPDELIPMISFHGALDTVVPIGEGDYGTIGSQILHDRLIANGICSDFTLDPEGGHVVYYTLEGRKFMINRTSCFFKSLFCDDCSDFFSTEPVLADCSGALNINESSLQNEVSVYPNPFKDQLSFNNLRGNEYFYLYNIQGQVIYEGSDIQSHSVHQLSSGLYLLRVLQDDQQQTLKLYKE
jgi:acetyl esterase/lipase